MDKKFIRYCTKIRQVIITKREIKEWWAFCHKKTVYEQRGSFLVDTTSLFRTGFKNNLDINTYLPKGRNTTHLYGLAEYGHKGILKKISPPRMGPYIDSTGIPDGSGIEDKFTVGIIWIIEGTVTERVMSARFDPPEVNSSYNVVLLNTFEQGKHGAIIPG